MLYRYKLLELDTSPIRTVHFSFNVLNTTGGIKIAVFRLVGIHNFWFLKIGMQN